MAELPLRTRMMIAMMKIPIRTINRWKNQKRKSKLTMISLLARELEQKMRMWTSIEHA